LKKRQMISLISWWDPTNDPCWISLQWLPPRLCVRRWGFAMLPSRQHFLRDVDGSKLGTENGWWPDYPKILDGTLKLCTIVWYPSKKWMLHRFFSFFNLAPLGGDHADHFWRKQAPGRKMEARRRACVADAWDLLMTRGYSRDTLDI
jgi:hypothetical protein